MRCTWLRLKPVSSCPPRGATAWRAACHPRRPCCRRSCRDQHGAALAPHHGQSMQLLLCRSMSPRPAIPLPHRHRCARSARPAGATGAPQRPAAARPSQQARRRTTRAPAAGETGALPRPAQPRLRPRSQQVGRSQQAACRHWVLSLLRCASKPARKQPTNPTQLNCLLSFRPTCVSFDRPTLANCCPLPLIPRFLHFESEYVYSRAASDSGASIKGSRRGIKGLRASVPVTQTALSIIGKKKMDDGRGRAFIKHVGNKKQRGEKTVLLRLVGTGWKKGGQMLLVLAAHVQESQGALFTAGTAGAGVVWQTVENRNSKGAEGKTEKHTVGRHAGYYGRCACLRALSGNGPVSGRTFMDRKRELGCTCGWQP